MSREPEDLLLNFETGGDDGEIVTRGQLTKMLAKANILRLETERRIQDLEKLRKGIAAIAIALFTSLGGGIALIWQSGQSSGEIEARFKALEQSNAYTLDALETLRRVYYRVAPSSQAKETARE